MIDTGNWCIAMQMTAASLMWLIFELLTGCGCNRGVSRLSHMSARNDAGCSDTRQALNDCTGRLRYRAGHPGGATDD